MLSSFSDLRLRSSNYPIPVDLSVTLLAAASRIVILEVFSFFDTCHLAVFSALASLSAFEHRYRLVWRTTWHIFPSSQSLAAYSFGLNKIFGLGGQLPR